MTEARQTRSPARSLPERDIVARFLRDRAGRIGLGLTLPIVAVALFGNTIWPFDPSASAGPPLAPPSPLFPMGTDDLGRDVLSGVLLGARASLATALGAITITLPIALTVGIVAGYRGGLVDNTAMRSTELVQVLPRFFLAMVVIALFGPGLDRLAVVLGLTSWPTLARVVRSEVMSLRRRQFIEAARAVGASELHIMSRRILPHVLPLALVYAALVASQVILIEAGLSFLGLLPPDTITWGSLAAEAQRFLRVAWWLSFFPALAIFVTVMGINLLADALARSLGPRV